MDYSKSVYIPEASLDQAKDLKNSISKGDLLKRVGIESNDNDPILVQMIRKM